MMLWHLHMAEMVGTIERRSGLSFEAFRSEYLLPRRPVIVTDAMDGWRARREWSPAYFRERFGDRTVETDEGDMTVGHFVDQLTEVGAGGEAPFLREQPVTWVLPELMDDMQPLPPYSEPNWLSLPALRARGRRDALQPERLVAHDQDARDLDLGRDQLHQRLQLARHDRRHVARPVPSRAPLPALRRVSSPASVPPTRRADGSPPAAADSYFRDGVQDLTFGGPGCGRIRK